MNPNDDYINAGLVGKGQATTEGGEGWYCRTDSNGVQCLIGKGSGAGFYDVHFAGVTNGEWSFIYSYCC